MALKIEDAIGAKRTLVDEDAAGKALTREQATPLRLGIEARSVVMLRRSSSAGVQTLVSKG